MSPLANLLVTLSGAGAGVVLLLLMWAVERYFERHPPDDDSH